MNLFRMGKGLMDSAGFTQPGIRRLANPGRFEPATFRFFVFFRRSGKHCKPDALPLRHEPMTYSRASRANRQASTNFKFAPCTTIENLISPKRNLGGDLSAGSPTDTLLRLNPPHGALVRMRQLTAASPKPRLGDLTGGVCKERGRIHRAMLTRDY